MPPVASALGRTAPNISAAEWEQRVNLAACYRLVEHFGWTDLIYTHISARVPGEGGHFLLNRFGLLFEEVTASNLIKVDLEGNLVEEPDAPMHRAGFVIHSAIHGGRDDVECVIHTHSKAGVAVAAMQEGLLPLSQHAQLFYGRVSYHDYEGLAVDIDERARLVRDLGDNPVMILRNHGLLAVGPSIPLAFSNLFNLQFACETGAGDGEQCRAQPPLPRGLGAHRQARGRPGGSVRHGMGRPAAQARSSGSVLSDVTMQVSLRSRREPRYPYPPACAFSRVAVTDIVGRSASGSTLRCRIAGFPDCCAAAKAGKKSAVFSTVAP